MSRVYKGVMGFIRCHYKGVIGSISVKGPIRVSRSRVYNGVKGSMGSIRISRGL